MVADTVRPNVVAPIGNTAGCGSDLTQAQHLVVRLLYLVGRTNLQPDWKGWGPQWILAFLLSNVCFYSSECNLTKASNSLINLVKFTGHQCAPLCFDLSQASICLSLIPFPSLAFSAGIGHLPFSVFPTAKTNHT